MTDPRKCPRCDAPLPGDSPTATCPRCMLAAGLEAETEPGSSRLEPPAPEELAPLFPDLDILELLGQGGMGIVYKARQRKLDRLVALKILSPAVEQQPGFAERFAREARALAKLSHPNIVGVYDFGEAGGLYYFSMEFVDGTTLRDVLRHGRMKPQEALTLVPSICDALQYAHDQGIVHRDIKPENVLLSRTGTVKIADFGLAKLAREPGDGATLTVAGQTMGTPHYMAPEQIESPADVDHRADIYSLGVVFYEMLTGELPLGRFAPPSSKVEVDVRIDDVVLRTLEKERELRYQHASEVKTRVTDLGGDVTRDRSDVPPRKQEPDDRDAEPPRWSRLAVWGFACLPVAVVLELGGVLFLLGVHGGGVIPWSVMTLTSLFHIPAFLIGLTGFGLSLAGWIVVARSRGRLRGLWLAVAGTVGAPLCYVLLSALLGLWLLGRFSGPENPLIDPSRPLGNGITVSCGGETAERIPSLTVPT